MSHDWQVLFEGELGRLASVHLLRQRRVVRPIDGVHVEVDGRRLINFASNDYLGLTHHPRVVAAMTEAVSRFGVGSGAAPLITGYTDAHASAESAIARWKGTESAVLFSSGYQANLAVVQALTFVANRADRPVRFLLDKLCHASLFDAVNAAGAASDTDFTSRIFPHNGLAKLQRLLEQCDSAPAAGDPATQRPLDVIVTESIFSMDGNAADLTAIASLKQQAGNAPLLLVDEAHGSGVYGPAGAGVVAELNLRPHVDVTVVTFSKALGVIGAAVCGSKPLCETIVNLGRAYIFSTSMPACVAAAAEAAIGVLHDEPHRQQRVRSLALRVRKALQEMGYDLPPGDSPIVPILLGSEQAALEAAQKLRDQDLLVLAIRPPTVPRGGSRLRITLSSEHSDAEIEQLLKGLQALRG